MSELWHSTSSITNTIGNEIAAHADSATAALWPRADYLGNDKGDEVDDSGRIIRVKLPRLDAADKHGQCLVKLYGENLADLREVGVSNYATVLPQQVSAAIRECVRP